MNGSNCCKNKSWGGTGKQPDVKTKMNYKFPFAASGEGGGGGDEEGWVGGEFNSDKQYEVD